ncbi:translation initiation factor IF-2-like [Corvus kubaryi]|uniref:translation initiation factor IF-2-like n=1 Tax=Corvus kubaryi TaxID=68294 RepID=UPI001C044C94|nr:translation initiation factor IF-2-like [Corvus kubaryi]
MDSGAQEGQQGGSPFPRIPAEPRGHPRCPADLQHPRSGRERGPGPSGLGQGVSAEPPPRPPCSPSAHPGAAPGWEARERNGGGCRAGAFRGAGLGPGDSPVRGGGCGWRGGGAAPGARGAAGQEQQRAREQGGAAGPGLLLGALSLPIPGAAAVAAAGGGCEGESAPGAGTRSGGAGRGGTGSGAGARSAGGAAGKLGRLLWQPSVLRCFHPFVLQPSFSHSSTPSPSIPHPCIPHPPIHPSFTPPSLPPVILHPSSIHPAIPQPLRAPGRGAAVPPRSPPRALRRRVSPELPGATAGVMLPLLRIHTIPPFLFPPPCPREGRPAPLTGRRFPALFPHSPHKPYRKSPC